MDYKDNIHKDSLKGARVAIAGFLGSEDLELKNKIRNAGGLIDYIINDYTTHVVASDKEYIKGTNKILHAIDKKIPIVGVKFIEDCLLAKRVLEPVGYYLTDDNSEKVGHKKKIGNLRGKKDKKKIGLAGKWRVARVFISSTFRDMHGERDYLTRHVFPELQDRCQQLKVHLHPIDLRWGVTSEDTANALEICLTELDACRPFFIGLLGSRYGWCPEEYILPDEPRFDWVKSVPLGRSITHLEMEYGVLRDTAKARCGFYFRAPDVLQTIPSECKPDFEDESTANNILLFELKDKIRQMIPMNCVFENYPSSWKGVVDGKPMVEGLEAFGKHVTELFWKHLQEEFPITSGDPDPLAVERNYHDRFVESHSLLFVGRQGLIQQIRDHTTSTTKIPLVIVGQPGSGKTSLVSYFAHSFSKEMATSEKVLVLIHFIGAAPGSTSIRPTLTRLIKEIGNFFGFKLEKIPEDFKDIQNLFLEYIKKVGALADKKLILIIDALNQLDNTNHSHSLDWLPEEVPENVRLIVSTLPGDVYDVFTRRKVTEVNVGNLTQKEQEEIVKQTLWQYRKKLEQNQIALLLKKTDAIKPLYLIVACEELRVFGVFEKVSSRIQSMADTVPKLFEEVLKRLEGDHDKDLLIKTVSLLTCAKDGLLEHELLELLGPEEKRSLPRSTWARLYRSLQNYLRPPGESGDGVLDFFHQQLPKAVKRLYLSDPDYERSIHSQLANYFSRLADPTQDGSWEAGNRRGLNFVAYHQIKAAQWENLKRSLCNLAFIEHKCKYGMTYDLVADYLQLSGVKQDVPKEIMTEFAEYQRFVLGRAHVLVHSPNLTFSMAYSLPNISLPAKQAHHRYYEAKVEQRPFLKWNNKPETSNPCIMTLSSHDMVVRWCVNSPESNARKILSASDDKLLKIHDALTGEEMMTLKGHTNSVMSCCYTPNGQTIASGGYDKVIMLWNTSTGLLERELKGHRGVITSVDIVSSGKLLASSGKDNCVKIWDFKKEVKTLEHTGAVFGCAFSPNGKYLAACCEDGTLNVYDIPSYTITNTWNGHEKAINSVSWSSDSTRIVTASDDRKILVWRLNGTKQELKGHKDGVTTAVFNNAGTRVLSGSHDNLIIIWDLLSQTIITSLIGHTGSIFKAVFSPGEDQVISCSFDRTLKVWEVSDKNDWVGHEARILGVAFSPNGTKLATASRDKTLKIWDTRTGKELLHLKGHISNVFGVCWSPDGNKLCSAGRDNVLKIWDSSNGELKQTIEAHSKAVRACAWRSDGKHILSCSDDKTMKIWDTETMKTVGTLQGHNSEIVHCTYSKDSRRAASCSEDRTILLWDTHKSKFEGTYDRIASFNFHTKPVKYIAFSPNDKCLVSGGDDNVLVEWNTLNAKIKTKFIGHEDGIRAASFSLDDKYIISGATDCTVRLWNRKTGKVECSFACLSRLCAMDTTILGSDLIFACGDGSGALYILSPEGLIRKDEWTDI